MSFFRVVSMISFCAVGFIEAISVPDLKDLDSPPTYYTPDPKNPTGDWIVYEGYYEPTAKRLWKLSILSDSMVKAPSNDWMEPLACFPDGGSMITTGYYLVAWNGVAKEGISFSCPDSFKYYETPGVPLSGHFTLDLSKPVAGFSFLSPDSSVDPTIYWEEIETGNMLRSVHYNQDKLVVYLVQGGVFQGAQYKESVVQIQIPNGARMQRTSLGEVAKYQVIDSNGFAYIVYVPESLQLSWKNQALISETPYTGYINCACIKQNQVNEILDDHARAVLVAANATLSVSNGYTFNYQSIDLLGGVSSREPLILLMDHQINKAQVTSGQLPLALTFPTLKGAVQPYPGSFFSFQFPPSYQNLSTEILQVTKAQAEALIDQGILDRGLDAAINVIAPTLSIPYNKFLYQKALTLVYAQQVIAISERENTWQEKLENLHQNLIQAINCLWKGSSTFPEKIDGKVVDQASGIRKDENWTSVVFFPDSYGSAINLNDHIVQYGYPLYALTLLDQYEARVGSKLRYVDQTSVLGTYTNKDLGNLLAADMGQSEGLDLIAHRNLDFYEGHSWLSGLANANDGQNTESESEAIFGSMSVAAWLMQTNASPNDIQIAKNRWFLETSSYLSYWQVDQDTSPYKLVCPDFVENHLVASMVWQKKITAETYWGLEWDRILACVFMPMSPSLLQNFLSESSKEYAKAVSDFIKKYWEQFDTSNSIQSILIPLVAFSETFNPSSPLGLSPIVEQMISDVRNGKTQFDSGTNELILTICCMKRV
jgi:endoglucanase Acf2